MDVRLIALDLDGTTLYDDRHISAENVQAIKKAAEAGVCIVAASGRCYSSLPQCIRELKEVRYAITSNGGAVYNMETDERIAAFPLKKALAERVLELSEGFHCTYEVFYDGVAYGENRFIAQPHAYGVDLPSVNYIRTTRRGVDDIADFIKNRSEGPDGMDIILPAGDNYNKLWNRVQAIRKEAYITSSVNHRIEISSLSAGKHKALALLLDYLGIGRENAAAFGNADNDMDMLEYVRYGMAVDNATEGCKNAAWKIVGKCTENGVGEGIDLLIGENHI